MPIYLFWGEEDYTIEQELNNLKAQVLKDDASPLNYKKLDNPPAKDLIDALRAQPMMFGEVLYIIKIDRYLLEGGKKIKIDDKQTDELIRSLDLISDRAHIALVCPCPRGDNKKPDSRKKFFKALQKSAQIKECPAFKAYEEYKIMPVLKTAAGKMGLKIDQNTLTVMIQTTGSSLRDLNAKLEKLKLMAHPSVAITLEMVESIGAYGQNIFALSDLILKKDYTQALIEISDLMEKSHALEVIAFLQSTFSKLLVTKLYSKTMGSFDIARKTGQNEYVIKKSLEKLSVVNIEELKRIKQNLVSAEFDIKTGAKTPLLAIEMAILEGC